MIDLSDLLPEWHLRAACRGMDPALFFPAKGHGNHSSTHKARAACEACPVRQEYFDYSVENQMIHGIWGGLGERARRRARKDRDAA